jgi:hypothetical protein
MNFPRSAIHPTYGPCIIMAQMGDNYLIRTDRGTALVPWHSVDCRTPDR